MPSVAPFFLKMSPAIVAKIEAGDALTADELAVAHDTYKRVANDLLLLGPKFHFAFAECNRRAMELEGYIQARSRG